MPGQEAKHAVELGGGAEMAATIHVPQDFATIAEAMEIAEDGDTIVLAPGEYEEALFFNKNVNLVGEKNNAHDCVISSKGSSVIKFRDVTSRLANVTLRVSGEGANWIHCLVIEGGNVTIDCCELTCGAWGMCVSNKSQVHICGCHVHDNTGCGITVYGGSKMTITESEICNNGGRGMSISEDGTVCKMRGCVVYGCSNGVYVYNKALIHMEENYVHSNLDTGLSVHHEGTTAQISRNYLQRNGWGGIRVYTGAKAEIVDNDLQENNAGALQVDKASKLTVVSDNNLESTAAVAKRALSVKN